MVVIKILGVGGGGGIHRQVVALSKVTFTGLVQLDQDSLARQTQPTPARIAFSIAAQILKAIRAGVGWVWLARLWIRSSGYNKEVAAYNCD